MLDWLSHTFPVSVNAGFRNKEPFADKAHSTGFRPFNIHARDLSRAIERGFSYAPIFRNEQRKKENFLRAGFISLDFDDVEDDEIVANHPIVQSSLTILYQTPSSTKEKRRYRLIFALEEPIERMTDWVSATRSLALQLGSDMAATDGARMFYGNSQAKVRVYDRGLTKDQVAGLIAAGKNAFQVEDVEGKWVATGRSTGMLDPNQLVRVAGSGEMVPLAGLTRQTVIHCPRHNDKNASAFVVVSSSNGANGVRCSACGLTYWPTEERYDFDTFDQAVKLAKEFATHANPMADLWEGYQTSPYRHLFPTQETVQGIKDARGYFINDRFLDNIEITKGLTLIKSPKGSGKTEFIAKVVSDPDRKVLLVGHRRALIRQLCERLNLSCYLDEEAGKPIDLNRYGVCLDSLSKVRDLSYDYIIVDESEQLLAHFLSHTIEDRRSSTLHWLRHLVSRAGRIVALDADLGWTTFRFFSGCPRQPGQSRDTRIWINEYTEPKKPIRLYDSKPHLIADINAAVRTGKRCFITSNSRGMVQNLCEALRAYTGEGNIIAITSENSQKPEIQAFLANITEKITDYQVVLTSPSVSTGVDISFPNGEQVFDHVFGLFEPLILTHFECDQQLLRVRHPKAVSVYVDPSRFGFETNLDVVKADLLVDRLLETVIEGYDGDGKPKVNEHHPLVDLAASVVSQQRASKNNLKRNFKAYKERQQYPVEIVRADPELVVMGKALIENAKFAVDSAYLKSVTSAPQLSQEEMDEVQTMIDNNELIPDRVRASYSRTWVEEFYRQPISEGLLLLHDKGRFVRSVLTYEALATPSVTAHEERKLLDDALEDPTVRLIPSRRYRTILLKHVLEVATLYNSDGFDLSRVIDTRDLAEFVTYLKQHKAEIEAQFDVEVRADLTEKPMSQLNTLLSFTGLKLKKLGKRLTLGDQRIAQYSWDRQKVAVMEEISKRRSSYPNPRQSPAFGQS